ncbi:MAG: hypothetical protein BGO68_06225 [Candidatus Amoebophilus sp. 36-38]|nr:MAG: hypothetical protein BGO68_06225 [Candidatus Amoebophilus sp. 36-38]
MNKSYLWLLQLTNFILYMSLQIAILENLLPVYTPSCFVYVGFFLFLPWKRTNLLLQLLLSFFVGLIVDALYNSLGVHTFAAVLLIYLRNFLLHILPPYAANDSEYATRPTLSNMGFRKFFVYVFFILFMYHTTVLCLNVRSMMLLFTAIPQLTFSIILSCFLIFFFQVLLLITASNTYIK